MAEVPAVYMEVEMINKNLSTDKTSEDNRKTTTISYDEKVSNTSHKEYTGCNYYR